MRTLYIDRSQTVLNVEQERLLIQPPEADRPFSLPLSHIQTVIISAGIILASKVLLKFSQCGINMVVLSPRSAESYVFNPHTHGNVQRRLTQYALSLNTGWQLNYARMLIALRLGDQAKQLARLISSHPHAAYVLRQSITAINEIRQKCQHCSELNSLRGLEGSATRMFFSGLAAALPGWVRFGERNRRPPRDPMNVLLSLTYTLVHAEATRAIRGAGLDPMLGFYHQPHYGRDSLACDLTELLRGRAERWIMMLISRQLLRDSHFSSSSKYPCILGKAGRAIYYEHLEAVMQRWRGILRRLARAWARSIDQQAATANA